MSKENTQFRLNRVSLVKSIFELKTIGFQPSDKLSVDINTSFNASDESIIVFVEVKVSDSNQPEELTLAVRMVGEFSINKPSEGGTKMNVEQFAKVNGPAIIYPYVRQVIRHLTLESSMPSPVILPIVNFQAFQQKRDS
ncbi:protein-export chaperone SecB [Phaeodactylibacter sp.]|jgi:preprotein translocase subunit SecB|uniref:protein-export chaperone SecB n=1 Tax=Phaeodactylibacter sp. TaxID=1940289 RepID=UPI0025CCD2E6|nr:protein-export chaperone SecB [Phaeodactylibacter sp.]MCI4648919.1 protein-export chaperone SecB [Phaeodactylibacter sp.]MCI5092653.1 protein-export chaperone SecB [Phaeodactylibacter sp.]